MNKEMTRIADYLLLHSPHIGDIGLFHGKMGIAVALYLYSVRFDDSHMGEFAWELFQQVYDGIHTDMPVGLEYGLAGIGYGTSLLNGYGILDGDLNDVLMEIDRKIMERDPRRMTDLSIRTGAGGILLYIRLRRSLGGEPRTFHPDYLRELYAACGDTTHNPMPGLPDILYEPTFGPDGYVDGPTGIDGGSAWHILKHCMP